MFKKLEEFAAFIGFLTLIVFPFILFRDDIESHGTFSVVWMVVVLSVIMVAKFNDGPPTK